MPPSPVTVIGLGQCGSSVTLELSARVDPLQALNPASTGLALLEAALRVEINDPAKFATAIGEAVSATIQGARSMFRRRPDHHGAKGHFDFYIADMNHQNNRYLELLKAEQIRGFRARNPRASFDEFLEEIDFEFPNIFEKSDRRAFETNAAQSVKPLTFRQPAGNGIFLDGAGGLQYISEYLAATDLTLYEEITKHQSGTLVGIFAAGGGTGAGSSLALLSRYKCDPGTGGYTMGLCVLPSSTEYESEPRAGRFLTRYLSIEPARRFDTLLLFSNDTASHVAAAALKQIVAAAPGIEANPELTTTKIASEVVNAYLAQYLRYYSEINQPSSKPLSSKIWDPTDGAVSLQGPSFIGCAFAGKDGAFDAADIFARAISPLRADFLAECLEGTAMSLGRAGDGNALAQLTSQLHGALRGESISLPAVYTTLKKLRLFFFISSGATEEERTLISHRISIFEGEVQSLVRRITEGEVGIDMASYEADVPFHGLLLTAEGGFVPYVYELIVEYLKHSFFAGQERSFESRFLPTLNGILQKARTLSAEQQAIHELEAELNASLGELLRDTEEIPENELNAILGNKTREAIYRNPEFSRYLITKNDVLRTLEWLVFTAMRPANRVRSPF
jgi:hypothetical protein